MSDVSEPARRSVAISDAVAPDSAGFIEHLQSVRETERISLARALHDDLGGSLVSAVMDLGWAEQVLSAGGDAREITDRLSRARASLRSAVDLKRTMTERLRPSLLDNFGLFAALRWHINHSCTVSRVSCREAYPEDELALTPRALTGLFRSVQDLLGVTLAEEQLARIEVTVSVDDDELHFRIAHEHDGAERTDVLERRPNELYDVSHRIKALGGTLLAEQGVTGTAFVIHVPLESIILPA